MIPCPRCSTFGHRVISCRVPAAGRPATRRRCECKNCAFRFNTIEQLDTGKPDLKPLTVALQPPEPTWIMRMERIGSRLQELEQELQEQLHKVAAAAQLVALPSGHLSERSVTPTASVAIEKLDLRTVRAFNSLKRAGVHTVGHLLALSPDDLMSIRGFGARSLADVVQALDQMELKLRTRNP